MSSVLDREPKASLYYKKVCVTSSSPLDGSNDASTTAEKRSPPSPESRAPTATGLARSLTPCFQYLLSESVYDRNENISKITSKNVDIGRTLEIEGVPGPVDMTMEFFESITQSIHSAIP